jgi:hypothetical protein
MPNHYHLKIPSAILLITFSGIALLAQQPASVQQLRRIYYATSASVSHLPVWDAKGAGLFAKKSLNAEKDITILLGRGAGPEVATALETGKIAATALSLRYAIPFLRGWRMLVDLTKTRSRLPFVVRYQQPGLRKVGAENRRRFSRLLRRGHATDRKGPEFRRTFTGQVDIVAKRRR